MSIDVEKITCEICGERGSLRFRGHESPDRPHPRLTETGVSGRRGADGKCELCGLIKSVHHDLHYEIAAGLNRMRK